MDLRPYLPADRTACLGLFDSNSPGFFDGTERRGYESFLDRIDCPYFVMEHDGAMAACGGYTVAAREPLATLRWGMVRSDLHRLGLGRLLLLYRLREIGKPGNIQLVRADASPRVAPFFEKEGFKILSVVKDGYRSGLDRVEFVKKLTVCA